MLTYQVRPRVFRFEGHAIPTFPAKGKINFHFQPLQPFGAAADGGRTANRAVKAQALFNANTGEHTIKSETPIPPLEAKYVVPGEWMELNGSVMTVSKKFATLHDLEGLVETVAYVLPALVNVSFYDPPYVERVDGAIAGENFRWEMRDWKMQFGISTQGDQEEKFIKAWERIGVLAKGTRQRLAAGIHYFHVACRLSRSSFTAGEFVAESVLNLSKCLEALFPPVGDGNTRDAVRDGLRALNYPDDEIESKFLPTMALRASVDVAHVGLCIFKLEQLKVIHEFVDRTETAFREMLERLFSAIEDGEYEIQSHKPSKPSKEVLEIVERIAASVAASNEAA